MHTDRRKFIKTAGLGIVGWGILPGVAGASFLAEKKGTFLRASPESQGVSSQSIRQFIAAANASGISWHSFMLLRHGKVVAEGWWKPYESHFVHSLYSLSKSFTSTAIGLLVKEGRLDIHSKLSSFFPDDLPASPSGNFQQITVRHLLTMNTGHGEDTMPKMRASQEPWVKTYLALPVEFAPGSHFLYNTGNTYMLGAIVYKLTGKTLESYLTPRLFKPLGIEGYDWEVSPQGLNTAGYGLRVKTEDIAKLGQLYLQKGRWEGKEILTSAWVDEATSFQTSSQVNNGDWSEGYGYQFWRCTHGFYRGDGAYGQFCIIMPQLDAVLAVTGQSPDMQKSMNIIWEHLPTGMQAGVLPENPGESTALKADLAGLGLPVTKGMITSAAGSRYHQKKWTVAGNDFGVADLQFDFAEKGCVLKVGGKTLEFGWEHWVLNSPRERYVFRAGDMTPMPTRMAGTATWVDDHTLQLNVRFVEAIFGDRLTCVFDADKLTVTFLSSVAETATKKTDDPRKPLEGRMVG
ncbi:MAG TPA: serine hydrolase [Puia sp.]|nr:serine hydrolase [Puia sp.]